MMQYASTPVFLSIGVLTSNNCIHGHGEVLSERVRKQVFQTPEALAASTSIETFHPSGGGFSDQITSDRVQTSLR